MKLDGIQEASAGGRLVIFVVVRTIIPAYSKSIADKVLDYFVKSLRKPFLKLAYSLSSPTATSLLSFSRTGFTFLSEANG